MPYVSRRKRRHQRRRCLAGLAIAVVAMAFAVFLLYLDHVPLQDVPGQAALENISPIAAHVPHQALSRQVYPYSVIRGGVHSPEELRVAEEDPVVRSHYAGFDTSKFKLVSLEQEKMAYVSYRLGDQVFWTDRKLRLKINEVLMTDGIILARARCGNQISETPRTPVSVEQPSLSIQDIPTIEWFFPKEEVAEIIPPQPVIPVIPVLTKLVTSPPLLYFVYPVIYVYPLPNHTTTKKTTHPRTHPPRPHPHPPGPPISPMVTPEPPSVWLFGACLAVIAFKLRKLI